MEKKKDNRIILQFMLKNGDVATITINESELLAAMYLFSNSGFHLSTHYIVKTPQISTNKKQDGGKR